MNLISKPQHRRRIIHFERYKCQLQQPLPRPNARSGKCVHRAEKETRKNEASPRLDRKNPPALMKKQLAESAQL